MEKPKSLAELKITMSRVITVQRTKILEKKDLNAQYLNYSDFVNICDTVKDTWRNLMNDNDVPRTIEGVCCLTLAAVAPGLKEKAKLIAQAQAAVAGVAGIAAIIGAVGMALGWGTGVIGAVTAFFCGAPIAGPIGLLAGGALLAAIAAYFAIKSNNEAEMAEKAEKILRDGLDKALEGLWELHNS